jgi:hypothetical protein
MTIPTSGTYVKTSHVLTASVTFIPSIDLIGDLENLTGVNADGEEDVLNRSVKQLDYRTQFLYTESTRADTTYTTSVLQPLSYFLNILKNKIINHDITIQLGSSETVLEKYLVERLHGAGTLTMDLNGNSLTTGGGMVDDKIMEITNCNLTSIKVYNGTCDDSISDKLSNMFWCSNVNGLLFFSAIDSKFKNGSGTANNHFLLDNVASGYVANCDIEYGTNGLYAINNSHVLTASNTTTQNPTGYGTVSALNAVVGQSGGGQFTGATGNNSATAPGVIR